MAGEGALILASVQRGSSFEVFQKSYSHDEVLNAIKENPLEYDKASTAMMYQIHIYIVYLVCYTTSSTLHA